MKKKQVHIKNIIKILQNKIEKERLLKIKKGKEFIIYNDNKIACYINPDEVKIYLDIKTTEDKKELIKNKANILFNRKINIVNTFMGYVVPNDFVYTPKGMIFVKTENKKIDKDTSVEIKKSVLISDKWLFVTANVYSEAQYIYQVEVKSINPKSKEEITKVCNRDVLSRSQLCLTFLSNELDVCVEDGKKGDYSKFFFDFINANNYKMERKNTIPTLGWNKDKTEFAPYSNKLHLDFSRDNHNFFQNLSSGLNVNNKKGFKEFKERMIKHAENPFADFAISCAFAAPLMKVIGIRSFLMNYYGASKSQKSLSARIGLACFGNYSDLEMSGNDTTNAVLTKIHKLQNILCYIDEIVQKGINNHGLVIDPYKFSNEKDRQRLDKNSEIRESKTWRTIGICTSETSIAQESDMEGEINRSLCINVDCRPFKLISNENECHKYAQDYYRFLSSNYGYFGEAYIKEIFRLKEILIGWYKKISDNIYKENNDNNLSDHISSIAIVCLGNYLYRRFIYNIDNIEYSMNLGKTILSNIESKKELDPRAKFINSIYTFFEVNRNNFEVKGKTAAETKDPQFQIYGSVDLQSNEIIFVLGPLKEYMKKNGFDWNYKSQLAKEGLIKYESRRISKIPGWRIIIPYKRDDLEEKITEQEERKAIQQEMII